MEGFLKEETLKSGGMTKSGRSVPGTWEEYYRKGRELFWRKTPLGLDENGLRSMRERRGFVFWAFLQMLVSLMESRRITIKAQCSPSLEAKY
jgi:hypothetical protein